jgi:hypothetical protein
MYPILARCWRVQAGQRFVLRRIDSTRREFPPQGKQKKLANRIKDQLAIDRLRAIAPNRSYDSIFTTPLQSIQPDAIENIGREGKAAEENRTIE